MCPRPVGLLFQPRDSLWIPVTTRAAGGQPRGLAAWPGAGRSLPTLAHSNFSPMLLQRSCVSPAYSLRTAASVVLPVMRSRCPALGPIPARAPTPTEASLPLNSRAPCSGWPCPWCWEKQSSGSQGGPSSCCSSFLLPCLLDRAPGEGSSQESAGMPSPAQPSIWPLQASNKCLKLRETG